MSTISVFLSTFVVEGLWRRMEGEKETAEEKEEDEEGQEVHRTTAGTCVAHPDLPIMHWEDLGQRIAELEKQEQERMERSKVSRN